MRKMRTIGRSCAALALLLSLGACRSGSEIAEVLAGGLGGGGGQGTANQLQGAVASVDTRNQVLVLQNESGQQAQIRFDQQTKVVYQSQTYAVTNLERGDVVTARIQQLQDGSYYTDMVQVDRSVTTSSSGGAVTNDGARAYQGTVGQIDRTNGLFELRSGNQSVTVSLPYNVSRADQNAFLNMRTGDTVRFYGVVVNNTRIELRQFY